MARTPNFAAGPAALPLAVIERLQGALPEFAGQGAGIMEISHRSAAFDDVLTSAKARLASLLGVPDDYAILFLQGGASMQFYMSALNLLGDSCAPADFLLTGTWSTKAIKEAGRVGAVQGAWDGKSVAYKRVPRPDEITVRSEARYLHYTSNNTIYGTQFHTLPDVGLPLVADLSSDICSRAIDVSKHALLYAGAQKNLGPSGVTAVILSPWAVEQSRRTAKARQGGLPSMLDYGLMVDKNSMFNTPNTFGIFALDQVLAWVQDGGGLSAMSARNQAKADLLYAELDRSDFWVPRADVDSRSLMNVTWRLSSPDLEARFVEEATAAGLHGLKGHRSVGGIRASLYNATSLADVQALVGFMRDFEAKS
ncbi:MAG: 3-phosphoserine/phosphohydroxythreonine transaminase [Oligoflexia bacterium]|nr:3-phosphoserine/phosphohydroxythreonine transaminase [Oligoflexia bacterium]